MKMGRVNSTFGSSKQIKIIDTQICRNPELVDQGILYSFSELI